MRWFKSILTFLALSLGWRNTDSVWREYSKLYKWNDSHRKVTCGNIQHVADYPGSKSARISKRNLPDGSHSRCRRKR